MRIGEPTKFHARSLAGNVASVWCYFADVQHHMMQYIGTPYLVRLNICQRIEFAMLDNAHCVDCSISLVVKSVVGGRASSSDDGQ